MGCYCKLLVFGLPALVCALIGMLCLTTGYVGNSNKNAQLSEATCGTLSYSIRARLCSYTCNCDSQGKNCQTCTYPCFDGYIVVAIQNVVTGATILVTQGARASNDVLVLMQTNYPINGTFRCFYSGIGASAQVYLSMFDADTSFIVGLVFCGLACLFLLIWFGTYVPDMLHACSGCCQQKGEEWARKREARRRERAIERENKNLHDVAEIPPDFYTVSSTKSGPPASAPPALPGDF